MLDGVVKGPGPALAPFARVVADAEPTAGRRDQGQVADQPGVDQAMMRRNARAGLQLRKQDRWRPAWHTAQRHLGEGRQGAGAAPGDVGLFLAVLPQKQGAPARIGHHPGRVAIGPVSARLEIGTEKVRFGQKCIQLGTNLARRRFDRPQPGQGLARLKLDLREAGKQIEARLLLIQPLAPGHQVQ